ncbi:hypothetical protein DWQ65_03060 [Treponema phagedenis]|uniref:LapA family protein n=1 Tax=Treponema phagedenis TaxID=162 RepID=A0A0B7GXU3_TREPH|nr:hypothetical protein [Treponema phagedenis]EFW38178.1 hypothetical protein HMPREF9554_01326 [Treponema phagedenis F0421]QSH95239.1 hypothetical protein C5O78_09405 [Treponema phagedenis]QSH99072.1 hypothetical protein DWQ65_03060 [Treponema phagedenis]CEM62412.1 conserved hypothetical protein [Treponema phagedenis]
MPGKLLYFIFIVLAVTLFAGFNMENRCNVSLIFHTFENIPIFITVMFSFLLGSIMTLPFLIRRRPKTKDEVLPGVETVTLKKEKKGWFGRNKEKQQQADVSNTLNTPSETWTENADI